MDKHSQEKWNMSVDLSFHQWNHPHRWTVFDWLIINEKKISQQKCVGVRLLILRRDWSIITLNKKRAQTLLLRHRMIHRISYWNKFPLIKRKGTSSFFSFFIIVRLYFLFVIFNGWYEKCSSTIDCLSSTFATSLAYQTSWVEYRRALYE